jgi:hypothetical protein
VSAYTSPLSSSSTVASVARAISLFAITKSDHDGGSRTQGSSLGADALHSSTSYECEPRILESGAADEASLF